MVNRQVLLAVTRTSCILHYVILFTAVTRHDHVNYKLFIYIDDKCLPECP